MYLRWILVDLGGFWRICKVFRETAVDLWGVPPHFSPRTVMTALAHAWQALDLATALAHG